ncbi:MAG: DUF4230 domain-containing protein [Erysipelotrichales bacterium]|nr:DUF4230 domain-containing protein [Erysipelotrichales bacterium]MBQ1386387.1 DUF4230 domain-containing protein [Erysipelotrichales bacterium]MBQ2310068.1 DUF4230 domain-containing protein [Erysipelotrichales bacterium]MBQ4375787.1 DUF4230 domain-containing protein [Erysipelotrichales bacterium]MBQ5541908.1 DUF4230 domain-containing protein [Erysipelotrichales bacterium]
MSEENKVSESNEATVKAAEDIVAGALKKTSRQNFKGIRGFFKGLFTGIIVGAILMSCISHFAKVTLFGKINEGKDKVDQVIDSTLFGYTAADYEDAILGEATEHQELVVMEQPLDIATTITKAGLGNLEIFSKTKTVTYYGKGVYSVNLAGFRVSDISVDNNTRTVVMTIPHAALQYVLPELDKTEFEDTERGFLAFGDIKLTAEQHNQIETSIMKAMRERLEDHDLYEEADRFAQMKVWDVFQPIISEISPGYRLVTVFKN